MIGRNAWILILSAVIVPLVLSCNNSPNPFSASDASISLRLVNSSDQRGDHSISDTVGKTVRVGVSGYLIQYISSANVTLYAVWTQNPTYTVTYNGNNNTSGTAPADVNAYPPDL